MTDLSLSYTAPGYSLETCMKYLAYNRLFWTKHILYDIADEDAASPLAHRRL